MRLTLAAGLLVAIGAVLYSSAGRDDAHITAWSAQALARHGDILNYNGDRIEQSSSLLHVILLAVVAKVVSVEMVTIGKLSSIAGGILTVVLAAKLAATIDLRATTVAYLLTATSPFLVYWSFGGLESTLAAASALLLLLWCSDYVARGGRRRLIWAAISIAVFLLARPEHLFVLASVVVFMMAALSIGSGALRADQRAAVHEMRSRALAVAAIVIAMTAGLIAMRLAWFGHMFPQPVTAKSGGDLLIAGGLLYLKETLSTNAVTVVMTGLSLSAMTYVVVAHILRRAVTVSIIITVGFILADTAFVLVSGGDWMESGRFLVSLIAPSMVLLAVAMSQLWQSPGPRALAASSVLALQIYGCVLLSAESTGMPLWAEARLAATSMSEPYSWFERHNRVNLRDMPTIAELNQVVDLISSSQTAAVRVMSCQMGMVPYYVNRTRESGQVEWLDRCALTDRTFTECPFSATLSRGRFGLILPYAVFFEHRQECRIDLPDVIFEVSDVAFRDMTRHGFTIVYEQRGWIRSDSTLPEGDVPAFQYIAVRDDLVPILKGYISKVVDFGLTAIRP